MGVGMLALHTEELMGNSFLEGLMEYQGSFANNGEWPG